MAEQNEDYCRLANERLDYIEKVLADIVDMLNQYVTAKTEKKKGREPSEYNKWVGYCMKEMGLSMKECAKQWTDMKKERHNLDTDLSFEEAKREAEAEA